MKRIINIFIWLSLIALVISSCKKSCDCGELKQDDETSKWMTIEGGKLYDGVCESKYDNGNIKERHEYRVGEPFGIWKYYYENGNLESEEKYENSVIAEAREWYENGKIAYEEKYENSKIIEENTWYVNGQSKSTSKFFPNETYSHHREWYENGKIKYIFTNKTISKENMADTLLGWYENGSKAFEFIAKGNEPMIYSKEKDNYLSFERCITNSQFIKNAKGKAYLPNGDWVTEAFYKDENIIQIKDESFKLLFNGDSKSISSITKMDMFNVFKPYIRYITFYGGGGLTIGGENVTIEEAVNWYKNKYYSSATNDEYTE